MHALLAAAGAFALWACSPAPSPAPTAAPPGATATPAGSSAAASTPPTEGAQPEALVVGCISIDDAECQFLARRIVEVLPAARGPAFAIEIQLFSCEIPDAPCPRSLDARRGKAIVEFLDREAPLELSLQGPALTPAIAPQDAFYLGLTQPSSPRVAGSGPFPFEVGHCGISHVIDFDGSFWLPIGQVDGDHPTIINAERGTMRLVGPNLAEFRGESGFTVQLARFPGPKHFWGCD